MEEYNFEDGLRKWNCNFKTAYEVRENNLLTSLHAIAPALFICVFFWFALKVIIKNFKYRACCS